MRVVSSKWIEATDIDTNRTKGRHVQVAIEDILRQMAVVEKEMSTFRMYIATQEEENKPLFQWAKYSRYTEIAQAVTGLELCLEILPSELKLKGNEVSALESSLILDPLTYVQVECSPDFRTAYLTKARELSISTSDNIVFAMRVMNDKIAEYSQELAKSSVAAETKENTKEAIMSELGQLLKHSIEATRSVWSALDLLERTASVDFDKKQDNKQGTKLSWRGWLTLLLMFSCFGVLLFHEYNSLTGFMAIGSDSHNQCKAVNQATASMEAMCARAEKTCSLTQEASRLSLAAQTSRIQEFNTDVDAVKKALEEQGIRIDNLWEALGPPNANGTYSMGPGSSLDTDRRLDMVQCEVANELKKLEGSFLEMKKEMQRAEVRLSSRLNKVERKCH